MTTDKAERKARELLAAEIRQQCGQSIAGALRLIRYGAVKGDVAIAALTKAIASMEGDGRARILEEAAKVAEAELCHDEDVLIALGMCRARLRIAAAIRALSPVRKEGE